jgi:hypothetical protein
MYHNDGMFCPCCGMQLRTTPIDKRGKEKIRIQKQGISK